MRLKYFLCAIFIGGAPVLAQECPAIDDDLDRLACYDLESGRTTIPVTEIVEDKGDWVVKSETSEFKDTTDVYMMVQSEQPLSCNQFGTPQRASLMLRCLENTTSLFISTDCHLASGFHGYGQVEYRIDDRPSATRSFDASTDNSALGLWRGSKSISVIKQIIDADTLLVRFTPFNSSPVTARFPISGLDKAITPLRDACNW